MNSKSENTEAASEIMLEIVSLMTTVSGIVLGLSVIMVILGGFKYITSVEDPSSSEKGKTIIIQGAMGIMLSMSAFAISTFFRNATVSDTAGKTKETLEKTRETAQITTETGDNTFIFISLGILSLIFVASMVKLFFHINKDNTLNEDTNTTDGKEEVMEVVETEKEDTIHDVLARFKDEAMISEKVTLILHKLSSLDETLDELDFVSKHKIEESLKKDLTTMLLSFENVNMENKDSYYARVEDSLNKMIDEINEIYEKVENNKVYELEKVLTVIEKRYDN